MEIRFDRGPEGAAAAAFVAPLRLIEAWTIDQVAPALTEIDTARAEGHWIAGYASYELGYALEARLQARMPEGRRLPLLRFGVYDAPSAAADLPEPAGRLAAFSPLWDADRYAQAFDAVHEFIGAGDIYQANLTFPVTCTADGQIEALYAALVAHQPVGHGALVRHGSGLPDILCRSPELFFRVAADRVIETRPMKGTMPRGRTSEEDEAHRNWLQSDTKNRAENLMIVDLLRNDISRVAETGSVHVPELFRVESYRTVHQMTSLVRARLRSGVGVADIFRALFPCGSITGAPKLRAMEILNDLEPQPRDIYCGTIGWAAPDGRAEFNVAIRTLLVENGQGVLNVGGGVVWDSTAPAEYEEALWKSRFAQAFPTEPV